MKRIFIIIIASLFLFGCNSVEKALERADSGSIDSQGTVHQEKVEKSENSENWKGMYNGVLPCLNCEGIRITLTLQGGTYKMIKTYLAKDSITRHSEGGFTFTDDGSTILLQGEQEAFRQYKVGENKLIRLDLEGNAIDGKRAMEYVLEKANSPILNVTWKLRELDGKLVEVRGIKPFNLVFDTVVGTVHGFAGCNGFGGEFSLKGGQLQLFDVFITEMGCEPLVMEIEGAYIKALREVDGFTLKGDVLLLKKGEREMAKLEK